MNRFIIDFNVKDIAKSLCDQHIVKMPLEEAQMLCTALWHHAPEYAEEQDFIQPVHQKHPCTLWAMQTRDNYAFAFRPVLCHAYRVYITDMVNGMGLCKHILQSNYGIK